MGVSQTHSNSLPPPFSGGRDADSCDEICLICKIKGLENNPKTPENQLCNASVSLFRDVDNFPGQTLSHMCGGVFHPQCSHCCWGRCQKMTKPSHGWLLNGMLPLHVLHEKRHVVLILKAPKHNQQKRCGCLARKVLAQSQEL